MDELKKKLVSEAETEIMIMISLFAKNQEMLDAYVCDPHHTPEECVMISRFSKTYIKAAQSVASVCEDLELITFDDWAVINKWLAWAGSGYDPFDDGYSERKF